MWYACNGILSGHRKKWNINQCYNIHELQKHCGKWKKPATTGTLVYSYFRQLIGSRYLLKLNVCMYYHEIIYSEELIQDRNAHQNRCTIMFIEALY
jgi:hypothetical protein